MNVQELANFIWSVADLLRGDYKQSDYGEIILPFTILRRLDCVLEKTKNAVLEKHTTSKGLSEEALEKVLNKASGHKFHNSSKYDFKKLLADPNSIARNMRNFTAGFSSNAREILEMFKFDAKVRDLDKKNLLFLVTEKFATIDLHPTRVSNMEMGYCFEELIRKFAETSNETAGEHFTPREVIRLMVNLLFLNDRDILTQKGIVKTLYDCACGTGGMLSVAEEYLQELNPDARLEVFGQELNETSYAICKADMMIKGQNASNIKFGNSFTIDQLANEQFDYMLANPPFGVEWKKVQKEIQKEAEERGFGGRFGAGLPRISDGSFLFLQHLISKMKKNGGIGSRIAIVFNGSPLFTGSAGSGESEIRRWIIENDMLEAIVALPDQLFYNTGISTYIWVVSNRKEQNRKGKIQLINATSFFRKMSRSLGNKRNELSADDIAKITEIYGNFKQGKYCKIFNNSDFGYSRVTVERPLIENGKIVTDRDGAPKPDAKLRDFENIPLKKGQVESTGKDIQEYMNKEVLLHVPDARVDHSKTKVGYEINFTKYFYEYKPLRPLEEIRADILVLEKETEGMLREVVE
jgi:type I restriction enzyme M protein